MAYNTNAYVKVGTSLQRVNLSTHWNMVDGKPSNFTPTPHDHDDRYNTKSEITTLLSSKAPTNHASTATSYGLGSTASYGHVKIINGLTQSSHQDGTALSAYQGKVLKGLIDQKWTTPTTTSADAGKVVRVDPVSYALSLGNPAMAGFTKCFTIAADDFPASEYTEYGNVNGYKDIIIVYNTRSDGFATMSSQWLYANTTVVISGNFPSHANSMFDITQAWWFFYWDPTGQSGKYLSVWGR